ncbi:hypothetical protein Efla_000543 [Eimeria flavescens]
MGVSLFLAALTAAGIACECAMLPKGEEAFESLDSSSPFAIKEEEERLQAAVDDGLGLGLNAPSHAAPANRVKSSQKRSSRRSRRRSSQSRLYSDKLPVVGVLLGGGSGGDASRSAFSPSVSSVPQPSSPVGGSRGRGEAARTAVAGLLLLLAVAWVGRQMKNYRQAHANFSLVREDMQKLRSQIGSGLRGRVLPADAAAAAAAVVATRRSSSTSSRQQQQLTEEEEETRNVELLAELTAARRLQEALERQLQEEERVEQLAAQRAAAAKRQVIPSTREEALGEIALLQGELQRLQQQGAALKQIDQLRGDVRRQEEVLRQGASNVSSLSAELRDLAALFRELLELERAFKTEAGETERDEEIHRLKQKLTEVLEDTKKACVWGPALDEFALLVEKDRLESELLSVLQQVDRKQNDISSNALLSRLYRVTSFAGHSILNSARFMWHAVGSLRGAEEITRQRAASSAAQKEAERIRQEEEKRETEEELAALTEQVKTAEALQLTEHQFTSHLHAMDGSHFTNWLLQKHADARTAMQLVLSRLRSLKAAVPPEGLETVETQRAYAAALESTTNKAVLALNAIGQ